jgi:hypothetical protein
MEITIACSYMERVVDNDFLGGRVVLVPDDLDCPNKQDVNITFELVYKDIIERVHYSAKHPNRWSRFFDTPRREYLKSKGCTCYDKMCSTNLCEVCVAVEWEEYKKWSEETTENLKNKQWMPSTERLLYDITMRTYYWRQKMDSVINIDSCYYQANYYHHTEVNFGEILLDRLNDGIEPMKKGRYIANMEDTNMVRGSMLLRRENGTDGSTPDNVGNVLIDGIEYLYEDVF